MTIFDRADVFSLRLTTIAQPVEAIGHQAPSLLLERLQGMAAGGPRRLVLHGRLMVRDSSRVVGPVDRPRAALSQSA
jgi:LacI family transcriptional regulator